MAAEIKKEYLEEKYGIAAGDLESTTAQYEKIKEEYEQIQGPFRSESFQSVPVR